MNELDAPLGLDDAGQDRACNHAAVAVFALTALAIIGGGGWYVLRDKPVDATAISESAAFAAPSVAAVPVAADAPMLRQELRDDSPAPLTTGTVQAGSVAAKPSRSITIIDGKTGKRETIQLGSGFEDDDAPVDGIMPAAAGSTAPTLMR